MIITQPPKEKRKLKVSKEEEYTRDGHWRREFSARTDPWFIIEHWAMETGFRLTEIKSDRRLYSKGEEKSFRVFIEIKFREGTLQITSWINTGKILRVASLFLVPSVVQVSPTGWFAIRTKRRTIKDLNLLLERFKRPLIARSQGLHIADWDLTTLGLLLGIALSLIGFNVFILKKMEVTSGLSNGLMSLYCTRAFALLVLGLLFVGIQEWVVVRHFHEGWKRLTAFWSFILLFTGSSLFVTTQTDEEFLNAKIAYYCILHTNPSRCEKAIVHVSPQKKRELERKIEVLQKSLAIRN